MLKIDAMNFSVTAAESWQVQDDLRIARRSGDERLQPWERRAIPDAGEPSAPVDASVPKQSDEDLLEIGRKRSEFLDVIDSSWAMRD
jgi:hypothetical protein